VIEEFMKKRKKVFRAIVIAVIVLCLGFGAYAGYGSYKMSLLPSMTFHDMLAHTTRDNDKAVITVGIISNGVTTSAVYGQDGAVLPDTEHVYEIGSLTKTLTSALLCKAISEGKVALDDQISKYIDLPDREYYPTIKRLVTHTSGYREYYLEWPMVVGFLNGQKNSYYAVNQDMFVNKLGNIALKDMDYGYKYSNFGVAAVGKVLSNVYGKEYSALMNGFLKDDLKLENTRINNGSGDLGGYWNWMKDDAYLPAGGLTSTIGDMLRYIKLQMTNDIPYLAQGQETIAQLNATSRQYEKLDIRQDAAGIGWMKDTKNNIIWHNGGTSNYNSYAAFDKDRQIGVVILSNCSPGDRIPATVMGVKLMLELQNGQTTAERH
jgi:CubicO group peptidase (beta-lactamase class C family)